MKREIKGRVLLYYNPYSGSGSIKDNLDHIIDRCQQEGYAVMPLRAEREITIDDVMGIIKEQEDIKRIIVSGGDGTIHKLVNAMVKHDVYIPIGLMPSGTANDFAFYFEIDSDIDAALDVALGNKTTMADVGILNDKYFINVCAMGAMIDVSQKTDPQLKNALGPLAYYLKAASELPQVHGIPMKLTTPNEVIEEEFYFLTVMNGESAGGFRKLSPSSSMKDGKLDVVAFKKMPIMEFGPLLFELINGRHPQNKNVLYFQTESLDVESPEDLVSDADGEKGAQLPIHFGVIEKRLEVFVSEKTWKYDD